MPRSIHGAIALAAALLLATCLQPCQALFGLGGPDDPAVGPRPLSAYNAITVRTGYVLQYLKNGSSVPNVQLQTLPFGSNGAEVTMYQAGVPGEVVLIFDDPSIPAADTWATLPAPRQVPFLKQFVYTSQAPAALLDSWAPLSNGTLTDGELAEAVANFVDQEVTRVLCVGEGPSGGLAVLCGPWAALQFPEANVDVVTFDTTWTGFNAQFAWSFDQLVVLHYMWPFAAPEPAGAGVEGAAEAVNLLITADLLAGAVRLPNLPAFAPPELQDGGSKTFEEMWAAFMPNPPTPEEYQLPPSDCPVIFCKTRALLAASCLTFDNETLLGGLPYSVFKDDKTDADAIVAWDADTQTAHFIWKYTEEGRDWLVDANGIQVAGFVESVEKLVPNGVNTEAADSLTQMAGDVQIHAGFLNQFESLAIRPDRPEDNITAAMYALSGGQEPKRVTCSGFSLGAGLSELCSVWATILWPEADVLVANQGGPIPGNEEFKLLLEATVGRAYKYVYRMDLVPSTAPFPWCKRVPSSVWIDGNIAMLQDRPKWDIEDLSWNDHTCDTWLNPEDNTTIIGYVPRLYNITRPTVPAWVFNIPASTD